MMKFVKKITSILMLSMLFTFAIANNVHADVIDPGYIGGGIDDVSNESLLKIIIILLTIILLMGIVIIKYLYSKYSVELKIVRRDENVLNSTMENASATYSSNIESANSEGIGNENNTETMASESSNQEYNDNIKIELDMKILFASMLIIVAVLIIVGIVF